MWVEVKIMFGILANVFIAIVISQIFLLNVLLGFLLFASLAFVILGDIVICYQIKHNHVDKLIDPTPAGKELSFLVTLTGLIDYVWANKKPHGKREFVYHGEEAAFINNGDFPVHTINGNYGSIIHESHDENINLYESKAADKIVDEFKTTDVKEVFVKAKLLENSKEA